MRRAGIPASWFDALNFIVSHESGWRVNATNPSSGAYGLPQALPGSKMASAGSDWRTNPVTQLKWMKGYVSRYGGGPGAAAFWKSHHWYANGGWADKLSIFGEVPGEPEVAINPARDTSESHIAEAIEARAKVNPSGFAGGLSRMIHAAQVNGQGFISNFNHQASAVSNINTNVGSGQPKDENLNLTMEMDGNVIGRLMFPRMKANMAQERIIYGNGGAIPVGRAMPVGGGF